MVLEKPNQLEQIYSHFAANHIHLKRSWLEEVVDFLSTNIKKSAGDQLINLIYHQWLYTSLEQSTEPTRDLEKQKALKVKKLPWPCIFQIQAIEDVGTSKLKQYKKLTDPDYDESMQEIGLDWEKADPNKGTRCYCIHLWDGRAALFKGFEKKKVDQLPSAFPGGKIMIFGGAAMRQDIILLTAHNCQVLGGATDNLMRDTNVLRQLSAQLKIDKPLPIAAGNRGTHQTGIATEQQEQQPPPSIASNRPVSHGQQQPQFNRPNAQPFNRPVIPVPGGQQQQPTQFNRPVTTAAIPASVPCNNNQLPAQQKPTNGPRLNTIRAGMTTATAHGAGSHQQQQVRRPTTNVMMPSILPAVAAAVHVRSGSSAAENRGLSTPITPLTTRGNQHQQQPGTSLIASVRPFAHSPPNCLKTMSPNVVHKWQAIDSCTLADIVKKMAFSIGCKRFTVIALVHQITEPFRMVEGIHGNSEWTMSVLLLDDSQKEQECKVDHDLLVQLVRLTPKEAMLVKTNGSVERRNEGNRRVQAMQEQLMRLDLVFNIEFMYKQTPVIKGLQTLAECLGIV